MIIKGTARGWTVRQGTVAALVSVLCAACSSPATAPAASSPARPTTTATASPTPNAPRTSSATPSVSDRAKTVAPRARPTLPRGGRTVFPQYRLVGYSGLSGARTLGRLGTGPLDQRVRELQRRGRPYAAGREVLPVLEIIATVVQGSPGPGRTYRARISDAQIARYLRVARHHDAILLLNIQPGRARFIDEVKSYERWLREPDVGVALDPEWAMGRHQVPGRVFGHTTGATLDHVSRYLSHVVARHDLPEKVMVYHQLAARIVRHESQLKDHPGVAVVKSVDGIGGRALKENTYRLVSRTTPTFVHAGFKLFFTEDRRGSSRLMTPRQVLALHPRPEYVLYE